jgi:predicted nuclease with TOPRIM domain
MPEETEGAQKIESQEAPKGKTFDEDYVKELRRESAGYRSQLRNVETERDSALSELEGLRGGSQETTARVSQLELENARLKVALDKGLPKDLVPRLVGTTEEELAADADSLLTLLGPERKGINDNGTREKVTAPDLKTQIMEAEKAKDWALARQLKSRLAFEQAQQT